MTEEINQAGLGREQLKQMLSAVPLVDEVLKTLEQHLPENLYYHNKGHTEDVISEALHFATHDKVSEREMQLLAIAAAYHDAGFLFSPVDNEKIAATMAVQAMTDDGSFTPQEISLVHDMIMDTHVVLTSRGMRQIANSNLSKYLLDADLSNLGRTDFFEKFELQRREQGLERELFLNKTYDFVTAHEWYSDAAKTLREPQKKQNIIELKAKIEEYGKNSDNPFASQIALDRLLFLSKLPLILNSSLDIKEVIQNALENLKRQVNAEAATVFVKDKLANEITFWAIKGGEDRLDGLKMPADKGVVGWVIQNKKPILIADAKSDERFFPLIDRESKAFTTKNMICVPLILRSNEVIGAVQVLNKIDPLKFDEDDLNFVSQFAQQIALAIENATLHEDLKNYTNKLEILERRKNEMTEVISHEFRTPLNVIQNASDLILSGMINDKKTLGDISQSLVRSVEKLTKIVGQIRNISLLSSSELSVNNEEFDLNALVRTALKNFESPALSRSIKLSAAIDLAEKKVQADPALILIVLNNLLSNAIRFTPDQGKIWVLTEESAGFLKVTVKDNGIGIAQEQINLICEKFYEVGDVMEHSSGEYEFRSAGLGLGLATVSAILKAHSSKLYIKSKQGGPEDKDSGSEFSFSLALIS